MVEPSVRDALRALSERDLAVRAGLRAEGELDGGYHPRMEAVHRENAEQLRQLIADHGWPHEGIAGVDGAEAAWLVAQHAIGEPDFLRACRDLVAVEAEAGRVPRWQHAYLDDRVRVFEGRLQRYGTQLDLTPDGPRPCPVEDPHGLDERRRAQERAWRERVGWVAGPDG